MHRYFRCIRWRRWGVRKVCWQTRHLMTWNLRMHFWSAPESRRCMPGNCRYNLMLPTVIWFVNSLGIGNLRDDSFRHHAARWKRKVYPSFRQLCRKVFDRMIDNDKPDLPFTNWYGMTPPQYGLSKWEATGTQTRMFTGIFSRATIRTGSHESPVA